MSLPLVGILGGGISGLSSLHFLSHSQPQRFDRVLFEKSQQAGGWIRTAETQVKEGNVRHVYEKGPRSIRGATGETTLALASHLGLGDEIITGNPEGSKRFLYLDGKVTPLPSSPLKALKSAQFRRFLPNILKDLVLSRKPDSYSNTPEEFDETIASFFSRHLGKEVTHAMVAGIVVGIYGGNVDKLSMASCFPAFAQSAYKHNSFVRGMVLSGSKPSEMPLVAKMLNMSQEQEMQAKTIVQKVKAGGGMFTFKQGADIICRELYRAHSDHIRLNTSVDGIEKTRDGSKLVIHWNGPQKSTDARTSQTTTTDHIISCIPSYQLSPLVSKISPDTSRLLDRIEFINMAVVSLAFKENVIPSHLRGFGYLIPPVENKPILGAAFDSVTFPSHSDGRLTRIAVMIGGDLTNNANSVDVANTSQQDLIQIALDSLKQDINLTHKPINVQVDVAKRAIPQYTVGHKKLLREIEASLKKDIPQLTLAGASYYGVSVNDCVNSGRNAVIEVQKKYGQVYC